MKRLLSTDRYFVDAVLHDVDSEDRLGDVRRHCVTVLVQLVEHGLVSSAGEDERRSRRQRQR